MKEKTINQIKLNILSMISILGVLMIFMIPYFLFQVKDVNDKQIDLSSLLIACISGIVIHELIHGLCFSIYTSNGFKSVKFGIKGILPYCHCKVAITVNQYRIAISLPIILLGIIPAIIGFVIKNYTVLSFGCIMIVAGTGDIILIWMLRGLNKNNKIKDHFNKIGFFYEETPH